MIKIVNGPRSGMNWVPLSMTEMPCPFTRNAMDVVRMRAEDYSTADNRDLGRDGPVCPYVAPSMRRDLMWVGRIPDARPWPSFVRLVLSDAMELYRTPPPIEGGAAVPRTLITVLPDPQDYKLELEEVAIEALAWTNGKPMSAGPHRSD
ncbi:DUF6875 domain-containing protein [Nocardia sp. CA-119907]|uniref:DUF6875 domain-containing protein n=1 Tax=Nocardia sp. CA-119907 TaxID=3239973 RepID=UPI003D9537D9